MKTYFFICLVVIGLFSSLAIIDLNGETIKSVQLQIGGLSNVYLGDFDFDGDVDFNDFIAFSNQYGRDQYDLDKIVIWAPKEADTGGELERNKWLYRFMGYWEVSNYYWGYESRDVINISQLVFFQPGHAYALGVLRTVGSSVYSHHPRTTDGRLDYAFSTTDVSVEQRTINGKTEYVYVLTLKHSGPGVIRLYIQFVETIDAKTTEIFGDLPTLEVLPQIIEQKCFDLTKYNGTGEYIFNGNRTIGLKQVGCGARPIEIREISRQEFLNWRENE